MRIDEELALAADRLLAFSGNLVVKRSFVAEDAATDKELKFVVEVDIVKIITDKRFNFL